MDVLCELYIGLSWLAILLSIGDACMYVCMSFSALFSIPANGNITNGSVTGTDGRRDIGTVKPRVPTVRLIRELEMANVWWTAEQFDQMSSETLIDTVEILGKIPDFSPEQLAALRTKATEVKWGR